MTRPHCGLFRLAYNQRSELDYAAFHRLPCAHGFLGPEAQWKACQGQKPQCAVSE